MKKRVCLFIAAAVAVSLLTACSQSGIYANHSEADELELVRTVGVDKRGQGVEVTVTTGVGLDNSPPKIFSQYGETLAEALKKLGKNPTGREVSFAHVESFMIGEASAPLMEECLDYLSRNIGVRLKTDIYIVRDGDAADLITDTAGQNDDVTEMLSTLKDDIAQTGEGYVLSSREALTYIERLGCSLVMAVKSEKNRDLSEGASEKMVSPAGFAVVNGDGEIHYIDAETAHGVCVLMGKMREAELVVPDGEGGRATVSLSVGKLKFKPAYVEDALKSVAITADFKAKLVGLSHTLDISDESVRREIEKAISETQAQRLAAAVGRSRELGLDFMNLGWRMSMAGAEKFEAYGRKIWETDMDGVEFEIETDAKLDRAYEAVRAVGGKGR